ncbi:MAG: hypothetical protein LBS96_05755 [Oscillospiraceae bacterium]|nr:hypothetical protein [Oscillospiraceae bacterium]
MPYREDAAPISAEGVAILQEIDALAEDVLGTEEEGAGEGLPPPAFPLAAANPRRVLQVRILTNVFFYLSLVLAVLLALSVLLSQTATGGVGGLRFFIEQTDAMEPMIRRGSLLITVNRKPEDIQKGDVIKFYAMEGQPDSRLTRVVAERLENYNQGGMTFFRTIRPAKGAEPDSIAVNQTNICGVKVAALPYAGHLVSLLNAYAAAFAVLAAALCCAAVLLRRWLRATKNVKRKGRKRNAQNTATAANPG